MRRHVDGQMVALTLALILELVVATSAAASAAATDAKAIELVSPPQEAASPP